ncbi:hypothetical protein [Parvularcula sp. LCG005]|uniref:hypothetical protein n=1 Tax=Parvularcula sp. LCG005 TaxID=3078805 RepID=UPI0029433FD0|nr:hypothetical protein [Parvularcula sp. LCG005]WOI51971.1 hypothetical protein RUI03_07355 [Parvularcula sp. LCG005]
MSIFSGINSLVTTAKETVTRDYGNGGLTRVPTQVSQGSLLMAEPAKQSIFGGILEAATDTLETLTPGIISGWLGYGPPEAQQINSAGAGATGGQVPVSTSGSASGAGGNNAMILAGGALAIAALFVVMKK